MRFFRHPLTSLGLLTFITVCVLLFYFYTVGSSTHTHQIPDDINQLNIRDPVVHQANADSQSSSVFKEPLLRILVLTYNRGASLARCLDSLNAAVYDGQSVVLEIHIDRAKDGTVHNQTLHAAKAFNFRHGELQVHVQPRHVGVVGQWLGTWRLPSDNKLEIAVFVEDDITLSPYFPRWLKKVHKKYDDYPAINGYALQTESVKHGVGSKPGRVHGPADQVVFLYPVLGSWGFSPNVGPWRDFISWYKEASHNASFIPQVKGLLPSGWYRSLHRAGRAESMWTMWHIYHAYQNHLYTLYSNLPGNGSLAFNWKEPGEHFGKGSKGLHHNLLQEWKEKNIQLPDKLVILDARGEVTKQQMSAKGIE